MTDLTILTFTSPIDLAQRPDQTPGYHAILGHTPPQRKERRRGAFALTAHAWGHMLGVWSPTLSRTVGVPLVDTQDPAQDNRPVGVPLVGTQDPAQDNRHVGVPLVGTQDKEHARLPHETRTTGEDRATTRVAPTEGGDIRLGNVVGAYKSLTTVEYARRVATDGWQSFDGRLWQRNYYERVIRDRRELDRTREYMANNPLQRELDAENPAGAGAG